VTSAAAISAAATSAAVTSAAEATSDRSANDLDMANSDCPFCEKLARLHEVRADELVWQFPNSVALLGSWQYFQGYCILVARRHATELFHLADGERRSYLDELTALARAIMDCFRPHKLNYELLGNQVPHLHWHVFPRYAEDPDRLRPVWIALDRAERDSAQRQQLQTGTLDRAATAERLRQHLGRLSVPSS
jgi:diadenosine tetraphosphate (Ap4A) HIT family hydrolase